MDFVIIVDISNILLKYKVVLSRICSNTVNLCIIKKRTSSSIDFVNTTN